jgi:hypothetical protein
VGKWRREHPDEPIPDGHVFTQPWPATAAHKARGRRDKTVSYQDQADRTRRTLRGIDEQVAKAEKAVAGKAPVKRNRFITLTGAEKSVHRDLEAKARDLAGLKGYLTNLPNPNPDFVIGADHRLFPIEASFRIVPARPGRPADLPPMRIHQRAPQHRLRRPRPQPPHQRPHRLVDQKSSSAPPVATAPSASTPPARRSPPKTPGPRQS